jgi:tetratricopeptide (TPR) repeat protein
MFSPRRLAVLLALLACVCLLAVAPRLAAGAASRAQAQAAFEEGNGHYAAGRYAEAVLAYERALEAAHASAALYHNLGSAHARLGQLGQAVRFYEKARRLAPRDRRLQHDLATVRGRLPEGALAPPPPRGWLAVVAAWPAWTLWALGLALTWAGAGAFAAHAWGAPGPPWGRPACYAAVALGLALVAGGWAASYGQRQGARLTVVVAAEAAVRTAPSDTARTARTLAEGSVVPLDARRARWVRVRLPDGTPGWIAAALVADV